MDSRTYGWVSRPSSGSGESSKPPCADEALGRGGHRVDPLLHLTWVGVDTLQAGRGDLLRPGGVPAAASHLPAPVAQARAQRPAAAAASDYEGPGQVTPD